MGQALPLPERIPQPKDAEIEKLKEWGFTLEETDQRYPKLFLPDGYTWCNNSWREDLPEWYVLNKDELAVLEVTGRWKETYDNELDIKVYQEPRVVEFRKKEPQPCETSAIAISENILRNTEDPEIIAMVRQALDTRK